jgi:uncharacterized protein YbjT (DUF2867 family)
VRPTIFIDSFLTLAGASVRERDRIELPFGLGRTNPVAAADVARVVAAVLSEPKPHIGRVIELTGPKSQDLHGMAREFSEALNRAIAYTDIARENFSAALKTLPEHVAQHVVTMAELHRAGRYDRYADGVAKLTGKPAMSVREFVSLHAEEFGGRR